MSSFDFYVGNVFGYIILAGMIIIGMALMSIKLFNGIAIVLRVVYSVLFVVLLFGLFLGIQLLVDVAWAAVVVGVLTMGIMSFIDVIAMSIWMNKVLGKM